MDEDSRDKEPVGNPRRCLPNPVEGPHLLSKKSGSGYKQSLETFVLSRHAKELNKSVKKMRRPMKGNVE